MKLVARALLSSLAFCTMCLGPAIHAAEPVSFEYVLYVGYRFEGEDQSAARRAEADLIEMRNVANQLCREDNARTCLRDNEVVFRKRLALVRGVVFYLARMQRGTDGGGGGEPIAFMDLPSRDATNNGVDVLLTQIPQADELVKTGLYLRVNKKARLGKPTGCAGFRLTDDTPVRYAWPTEVCR